MKLRKVKSMDIVGLRFKEEVNDHTLYWELVNEYNEKNDTKLIELWYSVDDYGLKMHCFGVPVDSKDTVSELFVDYVESYKDRMIEEYLEVEKILEEA